MKALELLKELKESRDFDGNIEYKIDKAIEELETKDRLAELETKDRLAELEKVILDYYLAKGYLDGVGGWHFIINISTSYSRKEIQIMFRQDICSNWETVFRVDKQSIKEMFDVAFEYFL